MASSEVQKAKARRKQGTRNPDLNREVIVKTALMQIDEEGLDSLSLRSLAGRLGVYPTAIYWYVPNRNELMAQIVTHLLDKVVPSPRRRSWQKHLRDIFGNFRNAVRQHPNAAPLIGTQVVSNATMSFHFVENILTVLTRAGLKEQALVGAYNSVIAALVGFIAQEFAQMPSEDPLNWQLQVQERLLSIDRKEYPVLAENLPLLSNHAFILRWQNGAEAPLDESFDTFVEVAISGIEALAARQ